MDKEIEAGDIVVLKSGSPAMTVTHIECPSGGKPYAEVAWFDGNNSKRDAFSLTGLEIGQAP